METVDFGRLGSAPGDRVLDLGCGFGRHAFGVLRHGGDVVACDLRREELTEVRNMVAAMRAAGEVPTGAAGVAVAADAGRLPFADGAFDRVIAAEVLEHIADDTAALAELARVLRPGGTLAVTVPSWLPERICWLLSADYHAPAVPDGHVRVYTLRALRARLCAAGLSPRRHHRAHALHTPYWWLRCAVGPADDTNPLVRAYHRLLCWEIERRPAPARAAERLLRPLIGKSVVLYAVKEPAPTAAGTARTSRAARTARTASDRRAPRRGRRQPALAAAAPALPDGPAHLAPTREEVTRVPA